MTYPCMKVGTAVLEPYEFQGEVEEHVNCKETIDCGQCPWAEAMRGRGTPVTGMFGTPCWYRGKSGTWMLNILEEAGYPLPEGLTEGFYGEDAERLPPEYCVKLGTFMEDHVEAFAAEVARRGEDVKEYVDEYRYAAWWLRWIAEAGDGATAWW